MKGRVEACEIVSRARRRWGSGASRALPNRNPHLELERTADDAYTLAKFIPNLAQQFAFCLRVVADARERVTKRERGQA